MKGSGGRPQCCDLSSLRCASRTREGVYECLRPCLWEHSHPRVSPQTLPVRAQPSTGVSSAVSWDPYLSVHRPFWEFLCTPLSECTTHSLSLSLQTLICGYTAFLRLLRRGLGEAVLRVPVFSQQLSLHFGDLSTHFLYLGIESHHQRARLVIMNVILIFSPQRIISSLFHSALLDLESHSPHHRC